LDDEIGADTEHRRLQRHAQNASGRAQATGYVVDPLLLREVLAAEIEPAAAQRFGHAHCGEHVCIAGRRDKNSVVSVSATRMIAPHSTVTPIMT
jgi:hypothetical protein